MRRLLAIVALTAVAIVAVAAIAVASPAGRELREAWAGTASAASSGVIEHARAVWPYAAGRREALADVRKGSLRLKFWGYPSLDRPIYYELLKRRYGIRACTVAGCVVTPAGEAAWNGYDDTMLKEIARRYGVHALDALSRETELVYRQRFERGELDWQKVARAAGGNLAPGRRDPRPH